MSEAVLEVRSLGVEYKTREGTAKVLKGVDLTVNQGRTLGLVGESGSGKSMTARAILNMVPPPGQIVGGTVTLKSRGGSLDLTKLPPDGRAIRQVRGKEIAMIFQEPMTSLSPVHTVGNQIAEAVRLHQRANRKAARERAAEMLRVVGFPNPRRGLDAYPFQLSGGMRQRAMIAMSLACSPKVLLADEPTTALDVTLQAQILELLQGLQSEFGLSILLISHNLGVVASVAERIAVMYAGEIVETANTSDIFREAHHPYTRALLGAVPKLGGPPRTKLDAIPGSVPGPQQYVPGCTFHPRCSHAVPGLCDKLVPRLTELSPNHWSSCLLHPKVKAASSPDGVGSASS